MNADYTPFESVKPERIGKPTPVGEGEEQKSGMPTQSFQSYMKSPEANPLLGGGKTAQISPFDLVHGPTTLQTGPTIQTILAQAAAAQTTLGDLNNQLNTPQLRLRHSQRYILKNKLSEANSHMRSANAKLGVEEIPPSEVAPGSNPITKFLGYVTDGQNQMQAAQSALMALKDKGDSMNPADLMLVQLKLNKAQEELEYSSVLLSKAVDDIRMLFGIQL